MITRRLAKAITRNPNFGEAQIGSDEVVWVKKTVYVWPSCQPHTKINIYVNGDLAEACDISFVRGIANS